jgi:signal transduction histidine kinase
MESGRILIVDDEEETRRSLSLIMKWQGYSVTAVENGGVAFKTVLEHTADNTPFDLLICDIQMPVLTGEDLIDKLLEYKINIPFLIITGYGEKDLVVRMMRKGCRDFIDKPFEPSDIEDRVRLILQYDKKRELETKRLETLAKVGISTRQIAHDIKNILTGVVGYADFAMEQVAEDHPAHNDLKKLVSTTTQATEICKTLLTMKSGSAQAELVITEMGSLVQKICQVVREIIPNSVTVNINCSHAPVWCLANAFRIQQALLNLGINAAQAMPDGGQISIDCHEVNENERAYYVIAITDSGCGISDDVIGKIFEPGFTTKDQGSGIGLPMVKEIVEEHNGELSVKSKVDEGTTFTIMLPVHTTN